ncbi:SCP2 sterol-binding domain-containing protein [Microbacterium sp. HJ5]
MNTSTDTPASYDAAVERLTDILTPARLAEVGALYAFHFTDGGHAVLDGRNSPGGYREGDPSSEQPVPDFEVTISRADFARLVFGDLHPMAGMATGRMKLRGDFRQAIRLDRLLKS